MPIPTIIEIAIIKIIMLNKWQTELTRMLATLPLVAGGATLLCLSLEMTRFGWANIVIDRHESEISNYISAAYIGQIDQWQDVFGYRLISSKAVAAWYVSRGNPAYTLEKAQQRLEKVIALSPLEPVYWLQLAKIEQYRFASSAEIIARLRLSYLSGRSVYHLMDARFQLALSVWADLDESDKSIALNDFVFGTIRYDPNLSQFLSDLGNSDLQFMKRQLAMKSADLADQIQTIIDDRSIKPIDP